MASKKNITVFGATGAQGGGLVRFFQLMRLSEMPDQEYAFIEELC